MSETWTVVIKVHSFDSKDEAENCATKFATKTVDAFQQMPENTDIAASIKCVRTDPEGEWQPMSTAPKDGRLVDLWIKGEGSVPSFRLPDCKWEIPRDAERINGPYDWCVYRSDEDERFRYYWFKTSGEPLFWMPLPSPPASPGDNESAE